MKVRFGPGHINKIPFFYILLVKIGRWQKGIYTIKIAYNIKIYKFSDKKKNLLGLLIKVGIGLTHWGY